MKTTPQPPRSRAWAWLLAAAGLILPGCSIDKHTVIASTGTTLGIELTQDQATQSPRMKVGYNRAELALVPSNRSANKDPGSRLASLLCEHCAKGEPGCTNQAKCEKVLCQLTPDMLKGIKDGGAADTAEVLMEIRMQGGILFNGIHDAGLYQRLAVGKTAVKQPGASLMFARDNKGTLTSDGADAVGKATAAVKGIPEVDSSTGADRGKLARAYLKVQGDATASAPYETAAKAAGYQAANGRTAFQIFIGDDAAGADKVKIVIDSLQAQGVKF